MCCLPPWEFWGWDNAQLKKARATNCKDALLERPSGKVMSRQNIRESLLRSEQMFTNALGYAPVETWFSEEIPLNPGYWNGGGHRGLLRTSHARVQAVGAPVVECFAEILRVDAPDVGGANGWAFDFAPGATIPQRAIASVEIPPELVGDITADEICVYIPDDFHTFDLCADPARWKIDIKNCAKIEDNELTFFIDPWLLAKPDLYNAYSPHTAPTSAFGDLTLDPTNLDNYINLIQVCRCTIDRDQAGLVKYNPVGCEGDCNPCGCTGCDHDTACGLCEVVNFCVENGRQGLLKPDFFACTPNMQSVCVHYLAGDCSRNWTRDISIYAAAQLCGVCECGWGCISEWGVDLAHEDAKTSLAFERMNSKYGTKRGEIHIANVISQLPRRILAGI